MIALPNDAHSFQRRYVVAWQAQAPGMSQQTRLEHLEIVDGDDDDLKIVLTQSDASFIMPGSLER